MVALLEILSIVGMIIGMVTIIAILRMVAVLGLVTTLSNGDHHWYSYHPRNLYFLKLMTILKLVTILGIDTQADRQT